MRIDGPKQIAPVTWAVVVSLVIFDGVKKFTKTFTSVAGSDEACMKAIRRKINKYEKKLGRAVVTKEQQEVLGYKK